jgi:predicted Zn-dependent peptidase
MGNVARQEMYFGRYISQDEIARSVDAVTAEQVLAVAQEFFHPERLALTVLGPINGLKISRADLGC